MKKRYILGKALFQFSKKYSVLSSETRNKIRKIIILKSGAIGDVLQSTQFLHKVRDLFPKAEITYYVGRWSAGILENNPNIDRVISFDESILFRKDLIKINNLSSEIRRQRFDLMFILDKSYLANLFAWHCNVPIRIGFDRYGEGFPNTISVQYNSVQHEAEYYNKLAYASGAKPDLVLQSPHELYLLSKHEKFAHKFLRKNRLNKDKLVCIAPGGADNPGQSMATRRWPAEKFRILADSLIKSGYDVLLIGSRADQKYTTDFNPKAVSAMGKSSLLESAALIKSSKLLISNDSAPLFIGSAVGTRTLSLFGVTDPRRKAPFGDGHRFIWKKPNYPGWNDDGVFNRFDKINTLSKIKVSEVLKTAKSMLK